MRSRSCPNAHEYVFWDDLHPTATVHAILAERVQMQLATPGDFNRDNTTDAADYVAWRKRLGSVYTPPDIDDLDCRFWPDVGAGRRRAGTGRIARAVVLAAGRVRRNARLLSIATV